MSTDAAVTPRSTPADREEEPAAAEESQPNDLVMREGVCEQWCSGVYSSGHYSSTTVLVTP